MTGAGELLAAFEEGQFASRKILLSSAKFFGGERVSGADVGGVRARLRLADAGGCGLRLDGAIEPVKC